MVIYVSVVEGCDVQSLIACRAFYTFAIFACVFAFTVAASESRESSRFATLTASLGIGLLLPTG